MFLVIGHFLVGVAAGAWLFGLLFDYLPVLIAGFLLAGAGGIAHLGFLGRPERCWNMARRVKTSWVARGFVGLSLFLAGAVVYLPPLVTTSWPWNSASPIAALGWLMAAAGAAILIIYMGFVYTASKAIPFWNSPLHPVLYMTYALRGGAAATLVVMAMFGAPSVDAIVLLLKLWMGITSVVIVLFVLELQGAWSGGNAAAHRSVRELLAGRSAIAFYGGTLVVGLLVPAVLASEQIAPLGLGVLAAIGLLSAFGDFFMKYATIRAGIYLPIKMHPVRQL